MAYSAYVLSEKSRAALLQAFPPKFPDVIAHHVTVQFGIKLDSDPPKSASVRVFGYASDASLEAIVVAVDGTTMRPDGKTYHITLSLDRTQGRRPVESNIVIAANGWEHVDLELELETTPEILK